MYQRTWLGWLLALLLVVSTFAPFGGVLAEETEEGVEQVEAAIVDGQSGATEEADASDENAATEDEASESEGDEEIEEATVDDENAQIQSTSEVLSPESGTLVQSAAAAQFIMRATVGAAPLAFAVFSVFEYDGVACTGTQVGSERATLSTGIANFTEGIDDQNLYCVRAEPPAGYGFDDPVFTDTQRTHLQPPFVDGAVDWTVNFTLLPPVDLTVYKQDQQGNPLAGAGFTLYTVGAPGCESGFFGDLVREEQFTNDDGQTTFTGLSRVPTYCVVESTAPSDYAGAAPQEFSFLGASSGSVTFVNSPLPAGTLKLLKLYCKAGHDDVVITVILPVSEAGGQGAPRDAKCAPGKANFTIQLFGDDEETVHVSTNPKTGRAELSLPATELGLSHVILEEATGAAAEFAIYAGEATEIEVVNHLKHLDDDIGNKDQSPTKSDGYDDARGTGAGSNALGVDTLPVTGAGAQQTRVEFMAIVAAAALLALAGLTLRRRTV